MVVTTLYLAFFILVGAHAVENSERRKARLLKNDYRDIKKLPEVLKYIAASAVVGSFFYFPGSRGIVGIGTAALFSRLVWFDPIFNVTTPRYLFYENPKGSSWWDRFEMKYLGRAERRFVIYLILYITSIILQCKNILI